MSLNLTDDESTLFQVMVGAIIRQQAITWANGGRFKNVYELFKFKSS